jgi:hypothetical protein
LKYGSHNDEDTFWEFRLRRFRRRTNVYLHKPKQYSIANYAPRLYDIARLKTCTACYCTEYCRQL